MLYLYWGENSLALQEKLAVQRERYRAKFSSGLNFWKMDLEEDFENLKSVVESQSMFEEKKLVFLRGVFSINENEWATVKKIAAGRHALGENVILVFYDFIIPAPSDSRAVKPNVAVQKRIEFFAKNGKVEEFKNYAGAKLANWAEARSEKLGLKIKNAELAYLINAVGADNWRILNELEKLAAFKSGKDVSKTDIDELVSAEVSSNIFKTTDALARRDLKTALGSLEDHWGKNDDPLGVLNMLVWQFRILLKMASVSVSFKNASAETLAKKLKINSWTAQKGLGALKHFGFEELKNAYQRLADIDLAVKTGSSDAKDALTDFVYGFLPR